MGGQLPGWVRAENTAAATVPASASLNVTVVLKRDAATQAAFEQLLAEQQTPGSALYHQWLTPAQVGSMFGLASADLQAVESWLEQEGLTVTRVEPNGVLLDVTGSVAAVSGAFRTNFAEFRVGRETRLSASEEPSVPTGVAGGDCGRAWVVAEHAASAEHCDCRAGQNDGAGEWRRVDSEADATVLIQC